MATAKAGPRKTSRNVTLRLTEGEADFLMGVMSMVGGSDTKSPRKYGARIAAALEKALGYKAENTDAYHLGLGHIQFFNYSNHPEIRDSARVLAYLESHGLQLAADYYPEWETVPVLLDLFVTKLAEAEERDEVRP